MSRNPKEPKVYHPFKSFFMQELFDQRALNDMESEAMTKALRMAYVDFLDGEGNELRTKLQHASQLQSTADGGSNSRLNTLAARIKANIEAGKEPLTSRDFTKKEQALILSFYQIDETAKKLEDAAEQERLEELQAGVRTFKETANEPDVEPEVIAEPEESTAEAPNEDVSLLPMPVEQPKGDPTKEPEAGPKKQGVSKAKKAGWVAIAGGVVLGGAAVSAYDDQKDKGTPPNGQKPSGEKKGISFRTIALCAMGVLLTGWAAYTKWGPQQAESMARTK